MLSAQDMTPTKSSLSSGMTSLVGRLYTESDVMKNYTFFLAVALLTKVPRNIAFTVKESDGMLQVSE